ncbi:MAG: 3-phosphoshikimate 1-carboxyvinyltransferase [Alphaproteobacteria bacterium]
MDLISHISHPLSGHAILPGDKSISHRALLLGALACGTSRIRGLLEGADVEATRRALAALGVGVARTGGAIEVTGLGVGGLHAPDDVLDLGNSGTGVRLLMGVLAGHDFPVFLTGDASLRRRPMARVGEPLAAMGARLTTSAGGRLPLVVTGPRRLQPLDWQSAIASAQVKSAILLAGLHAPGRTSVTEPALSRDHTENMLAAMGAPVTRERLPDGRHRVAVDGEAELRPLDLTVPADPSSAAFPLVAALLVPGSTVRLRGVGLNPTRTGLLDVVARMGATVAIENRRELGGEPAGDLVVRSGELRAVDVAAEAAPAMIDEYPILAVAAALARGRSVLRGVGELRVKETDRLAAMAAGLTAAGVEVEEGEDWLAVHGTDGAPPRGGAIVDAEHDHRIAMSFAVLGLTAREGIRVRGAETIETSFPGFVELMTGLGARLETA